MPFVVCRHPDEYIEIEQNIGYEVVYVTVYCRYCHTQIDSYTIQIEVDAEE